MKRIDWHRTGFATAFLACAVYAHVALPHVALFALVLTMLSGLTILVCRVPVAIVTPPTALSRDRTWRLDKRLVAPVGTAMRQSQLVAAEFDSELAGIEAELHTLVDQYRTEISAGSAGIAPDWRSSVTAFRSPLR